MKKRNYLIYLIGALGLLLSGCQEATKTKEIQAAESKMTLHIRNPKVEIATQFEQMASAYEQEHPYIDIEIETVGGATDDLADLKAQLAAGTGPDIFTNNGYEQARLWRKYLEDLSDQSWVKNAYEEALYPITFDEKIYGMPMNMEGYGVVYNKDLFAKAGIHEPPNTLKELRFAAKKIQQAGITPFASGYYEDWKLGVLLVNVAFAQQNDPDEFIKNLHAGTEKITTNQLFKDLIQLLDMTVQYGNNDPLTTDYTMELNQFTSGEAAMILQGNWIQPMIDQVAPNMNIGFLPIPIHNDQKNDALVVSVPNYWVVNNQSSPEKKQEAKKFLNWMVSSEQGKTFLTEEFKFIPAFKHIETDDLGPLANDTLAYYKRGNIVSSNWYHFPVGVKEQFGTFMQQYIAHQLNRDQLLRELQTSWDRASSQMKTQTP